jgi:hypothetical protein
MNAICGIHHKTEPLPNDALAGMVRALAAWGRDGSSTWLGDHIALGCQATHVTPESIHENLPLADAGLVITADARLDNRDNLISDLRFTIYDSPTQSEIPFGYDVGNRKSKIGDSEIILAAYRKWGVDCPKHLLGDFAFAVWDENEKMVRRRGTERGRVAAGGAGAPLPLAVAQLPPRQATPASNRPRRITPAQAGPTQALISSRLGRFSLLLAMASWVPINAVLFVSTQRFVGADCKISPGLARHTVPVSFGRAG